MVLDVDCAVSLRDEVHDVAFFADSDDSLLGSRQEGLEPANDEVNESFPRLLLCP